MLTSRSEVLTPAELSMKSVLRRPPRERVLDAAALRAAEVAAFADHLARAARVPLTRTASLARSPTSACDSSLRLHVGADAAVPQQVDRHAQDGADDLDRASRVAASSPSSALRLGDSAIDLALRGNTPPPREISLRS